MPQNCSSLLLLLKQHAKQHQTFTDLKPTMFVGMTKQGRNKKVYPKLKGKAAFIKHAAPGLLQAWLSHMDSSKIEHVQIRMALAASIQMDELCNSNTNLFRLPAAEAKAFEEATNKYAILCNALHDFHKSEKLFNVTIKLHYLLEAGARAKHLHPGLACAWGTEDFVARIKELIAPVSVARKPQLALRAAFQRYRRGMDAFFQSGLSSFSKL